MREATKPQQRWGVMGGTFDPIHHGHLLAAEEARWQFELDRVLFVPSGRPWQKAAVTAAEERYLMTVIATASNPSFAVSRIEIDHPGPSYTVETLHALRATLGESVELFFITGADAVAQILTWRSPQEVLGLAQLIAATRPGYDAHHLIEQMPQARSRVHLMEIPALAISSTDIRERVRRGAPIRYLLPGAVARYIEKQELYRHARAPDAAGDQGLQDRASTISEGEGGRGGVPRAEGADVDDSGHQGAGAVSGMEERAPGR